jgi:uncharacterized RDD family membrane protein YckC
MDDRYLVTTPENIPISYELAGLGSRFVATLVDTLITVTVELGLILAAVVINRIVPFESLLSGDAFFYFFLAIVILIYSGSTVGYPLLFEIIWSGQTPGKRWAGIRVVGDDGGPLTLSAAIIRNVLRLVDSLPLYYIIGVTIMLLDRKSRRLGDLAAGTICVKERKDVAVDDLLAPVFVERSGDSDAGAAFENLRLLNYDDYYLINEYLARRAKLAPAAAERVGEQIAQRIALKLGVERERGERAEAFLARVSAALQSRARR